MALHRFPRAFHTVSLVSISRTQRVCRGGKAGEIEIAGIRAQASEAAQAVISNESAGRFHRPGGFACRSQDQD
jgi:hypothetical protein